MNEKENVQLLQEGSTYRYLCCFETGINYLRVENASSIINANLTITITSLCKCGATSGSSSKHIWTATSNENVVKCKKCARTKILAPGEIIPIIKTRPIIIEEESE